MDFCSCSSVQVFSKLTFIIFTDANPMTIVGEYGNEVVNGAGCGGAEANGHMFLNGGVSASGAGATQSTFTVYALPDTEFDNNFPNAPAAQNQPLPVTLFKDEANTNTIGNIDGVDDPNETGQLPSQTTRRDSHGATETIDGKYVHIVDRIQNLVEVFDAETLDRVNTYDLTTSNGELDGLFDGPCFDKSVVDDSNLPPNDPAPDLMHLSPDGKYIFVAFRGPKPVSVNHAAQGSCPGAGIIEVTEDGAGGKVKSILCNATFDHLHTS